MLQETWDNQLGVGGLSGRGDELEAYVFVPAEHFSELVSAVSSGRICTVEFSGTKLKRNMGTAISVTVATRVRDHEEENVENLGQS